MIWFLKLLPMTLEHAVLNTGFGFRPLAPFKFGSLQRGFRARPVMGGIYIGLLAPLSGLLCLGYVQVWEGLRRNERKGCLIAVCWCAFLLRAAGPSSQKMNQKGSPSFEWFRSRLPTAALHGAGKPEVVHD